MYLAANPKTNFANQPISKTSIFQKHSAASAICYKIMDPLQDDDDDDDDGRDVDEGIGTIHFVGQFHYNIG